MMRAIERISFGDETRIIFEQRGWNIERPAYPRDVQLVRRLIVDSGIIEREFAGPHR